MLLVEDWGLPGECDNPIIESVENKGALYLEGTFMQAEVVNKNKRLYPKKVLKAAVDKYINEQIKTRQSLGELNHPARANVDPMLAAIIIEDLWWEGNDVKGRARVIEGDNGPGDKLAANIRAGWLPGVSSRGLGALKPSGVGHNIVQEGFRLTVAVDVVWGPSAPNAIVQPKRIDEATLNKVEPKPSADEVFNLITQRLKAL